MIDNRKQAKAGGKVKKTYTRPELTRLGAVSELTSGGTGTKAEFMLGIIMMRHP